MIKSKRFDPFIIGAAILTAILNIYGIWYDQYANAYYTATVTSMLQSFHNFFFVSFDPGGFVTVDKPPVAFWVQTLFAMVFGVHGWTVILPQAIAGVGSVLLIYFLVKPTSGRSAAQIAGFVMACTPVAVADSRTNNVDSLLVFVLLLAAGMLFRAAKTSKPVWCISSFGMIGIGFNIKMLQAYMVLPAFYLFYWLAYKVDWKKKIRVLAASTAVLLILSFSWVLIVDNIPAADRPYIGSSQTNSVLELAFGYNGISRLTGQRGPGGNNWGGISGNQAPGIPQRNRNQIQGSQQWPNNIPPSQGFGNSPNGSLRRQIPPRGGMFNTGTAGPFRLFQSQLSGQISWLLPFALLAAISLLINNRRKQALTDKQTESLFWLAWLLPMIGFFSIAGFFHPYYLIMLAPAISALTGAGWADMAASCQNSESWKKWLLPVGILGTTGFQLYIMLPYQNQIGLALPAAVGILGGISGFYLIFNILKNKETITQSSLKELKEDALDLSDSSQQSFAQLNDAQSSGNQANVIKNIKAQHNVGLHRKLIKTAAMVGIAALLAAPLYWTATPMLYGENSAMPEAGPQLRSDIRSGRPGQTAAPGQIPSVMFGMNFGPMQERIDPDLLGYLEAHNTGEKFLFATANAGTAEAYIIDTRQAVMAMGGFSGSDPILTVNKLKQMIADKEIKYFLLTGGGPGRGSSDVQAWIQQNGTVIPESEWQPSSTNTEDRGLGRNGAATLYEVNP